MYPTVMTLSRFYANLLTLVKDNYIMDNDLSKLTALLGHSQIAQGTETSFKV